MEYRRKPVRRNRRKRRSDYTGGGMGVLLSLLLVAGIIYVAVSNAAGDWIESNIITPAMNVFDNGTANEKEKYSDKSDPVLTLNNDNEPSISEKYTFNGLDCYMLQMGVFSSKENAMKLSSALKERGAAGYIYEDNSSEGKVVYRVIASGYTDKESASNVRDRLIEEGTDCTVYSINPINAVFNLSAPEKTIETAKASFDAFPQMMQIMNKNIFEFDSLSMEQEMGKQMIVGYIDTLNNAVNNLNSFDTADNCFGIILAFYNDALAKLNELYSGTYSSNTEFSAALKHAYVEMAAGYAKLLGDITS